MKLEALEITATSARMEWRHLDEQEEKPHVDGIQVSLKTLGFYSTYHLTNLCSLSSAVSSWTPMESLYHMYLRYSHPDHLE